MIYIEKLHQWATKENEMNNSSTAHDKLIVTIIYSACGVLHESKNKAYLWIITVLQARNWSQITFCNLTNVVTSISLIYPIIEQINILPWEEATNCF